LSKNIDLSTVMLLICGIVGTTVVCLVLDGFRNKVHVRIRDYVDVDLCRRRRSAAARMSAPKAP
jgi:hypothetical protein